MTDIYEECQSQFSQGDQKTVMIIPLRTPKLTMAKDVSYGAKEINIFHMTRF